MRLLHTFVLQVPLGPASPTDAHALSRWKSPGMHGHVPKGAHHRVQNVCSKLFRRLQRRLTMPSAIIIEDEEAEVEEEGV
mmetsp:Transcript_19670/g.31402  ORF Transcript_19670/g.31402 Transcript_19670/m.31402 type:complete len:80 (+) Transcript_19670:874-1113(+)